MPVPFGTSSFHENVAPYFPNVTPRCFAYHAPSAFGSALRRNTPPTPVTLAMPVTSALLLLGHSPGGNSGGLRRGAEASSSLRLRALTGSAKKKALSHSR